MIQVRSENVACTSWAVYMMQYFVLPAYMCLTSVDTSHNNTLG